MAERADLGLVVLQRPPAAPGGLAFNSSRSSIRRSGRPSGGSCRPPCRDAAGVVRRPPLAEPPRPGRGSWPSPRACPSVPGRAPLPCSRRPARPPATSRQPPGRRGPPPGETDSRRAGGSPGGGPRPADPSSSATRGGTTPAGRVPIRTSTLDACERTLASPSLSASTSAGAAALIVSGPSWPTRLPTGLDGGDGVLGVRVSGAARPGPRPSPSTRGRPGPAAARPGCGPSGPTASARRAAPAGTPRGAARTGRGSTPRSSGRSRRDRRAAGSGPAPPRAPKGPCVAGARRSCMRAFGRGVPEPRRSGPGSPPCPPARGAIEDLVGLVGEPRALSPLPVPPRATAGALSDARPRSQRASAALSRMHAQALPVERDSRKASSRPLVHASRRARSARERAAASTRVDASAAPPSASPRSAGTASPRAGAPSAFEVRFAAASGLMPRSRSSIAAATKAPRRSPRPAGRPARGPPPTSGARAGRGRRARASGRAPRRLLRRSARAAERGRGPAPRRTAGSLCASPAISEAGPRPRPAGRSPSSCLDRTDLAPGGRGLVEPPGRARHGGGRRRCRRRPLRVPGPSTSAAAPRGPRHSRRATPRPGSARAPRRAGPGRRRRAT